MSFTNENLITSNSLEKEFAYLENFENQSMRYTLSLMDVLSSRKLSHVLDSTGSSETNIKDLAFDEFNKLKTEFILDGTGYSSRDEYFEKNSGKDEHELSNDFYELYTSQIKKKEKSFADFLKFLEINQENLGRNLDEIKGTELQENEFYFLSKRPQTPIEISQNRRTAVLYKIISNITWEAFDSYASQADDIQTLIISIEKDLEQFSQNIIINHSEAGTAQGIFPLYTYKYIDNVNLHEWTIDSVKTKEEYSELMFDSYGMSFGDFLKFYLKTSGKDLYSFKQISEAQTLNKLSLINLTAKDVEALEKGDENYSMLPNEVFDVLIGGYDLIRIKKLLFSEDFKIKNKDLFSYLDDMKISYYKKFNTNQSFKIRKFYDYKQDSRNLDKFFVICSIDNEVYKDSFSLWDINEDKIINFESPFNNSLFNLEVKKESGVYEKEIKVGKEKRTYIFESGYNPDKTSFNSTLEAANYFLDKNQFVFAGIRYLITDQFNLDDDNFFYYDFFFEGQDETSFTNQILNLIATSTNLNDFESKLKANKIDFNKKEVYTKDVINEYYYLIGSQDRKKIIRYGYIVTGYDSNFSPYLPRCEPFETSITKTEMINFIGGTEEQRQDFNFIKNQLQKYTKKYIIFRQNIVHSYGEFIHAIEAIIEEIRGHVIPLEYFGIPIDKNRYKKTVLYFNKLDNKFYEVELFTLLGEVERSYFKKDSLFKKVNSNGMPFVNNHMSYKDGLGYYIDYNNRIKEIGTLDSIKTNEQYQKLLKVFEGKGYDEIYDGMYFDNEGAKKLEDLLINNLTSYATTTEPDGDLAEFNNFKVLATENELMNLMNEYSSSNDKDNQTLLSFLRSKNILALSSGIIYNKEVQEKYDGIYYDLENGMKKKLEFLYFAKQISNAFFNEPKHNGLYKHHLMSITMPEKTFRETIFKNYNHSIKSKYFVNSKVLDWGPVRTYIDQYNMKYWFTYWYSTGYHIDSFKKTNIYYFDKTTKKLWKVGKDYTFFERTTHIVTYQSGLMQCSNYNDLYNWGINWNSPSFGFYDVTQEIDFGGQYIASDAIQTYNKIKNETCYSHQEKGTVESMFEKYVPKEFIRLSDGRFAFSIDSSLALNEEYDVNNLTRQIENSLESNNSEFLSKFRFFSEKEMNEITEKHNFLNQTRLSISEIKISNDELEKILK